MKARKEVELEVRLGNQRGGLRRVLRAVADENVNVLAYCCYSDRDDTVVLLVTEDALTAKAALLKAGLPSKANDIVVVGAAERVGAAAQLGVHLANVGVDILYSYASSSGAQEFCAVFKTTNDDLAVRALDASPFAHAA